MNGIYNNRIHEILNFLFAGGICFIFELTLLYVLTEYLNLSYLFSSGLAFSIAVIINYILCKKFVFRVQNKNKKAFLLFVVTSIIGLGINQLCMWFLVEKIFLYYMFAKILATAVVTFWNYITKKIILQN